MLQQAIMNMASHLMLAAFFVQLQAMWKLLQLLQAMMPHEMCCSGGWQTRGNQVFTLLLHHTAMQVLHGYAYLVWGISSHIGIINGAQWPSCSCCSRTHGAAGGCTQAVARWGLSACDETIVNAHLHL
jgi:hypothetical protein